MRLAFCRVVLLVVMAAFAVPAWGQVGSKDVFEQVSAGPYKLFVTVRMPTVIPGVATIEARASGPQVSSIRITPVPLTGEASKHPPAADAMKASAADPQFFTGSLWLMASGSWQVRFEVDGAAGAASAGGSGGCGSAGDSADAAVDGDCAGRAGADSRGGDDGDRRGGGEGGAACSG